MYHPKLHHFFLTFKNNPHLVTPRLVVIMVGKEWAGLEEERKVGYF